MNFNVNNLTITEEAFEVFQTSAMNSEHDYVASGTTACPQPVTVNVTNDLNEMSSENDVVSSTIAEEQPELSYCNLEVGCEVNIDEGDTTVQSSTANPDSNYANEASCMITENNEVHKDVASEPNVELDEPMELETVTNSEVYQDLTLISSKRGKGGGRGRGRGRGRARGKPRVSARKQVESITAANTDLNTDISDTANLARETILHNTLETPESDAHLLLTEDSNLKKPPVQSSNNSLEEIVTVRRGGRRKNIIPTSVTSDLQSLDSNISSKVSRKRGRPKKGQPKQNVTINENLSPLNGDNLPSDSKTSEVKDLSKMVKNLAQMEDDLTKLKAQLSTLENLDDEDDEEDVCLSKLKKCTDTDNNISEPKDPILEELKELPSSPISVANNNTEEIKVETLPEVMDIERNPEEVKNELNIDDVIAQETGNVEEISENKIIDPSESLLVEDVSKRPQRRKAKTTLKYRNDDDSDEDPFANVELSEDDEPRRGKKGGRYQSDDEYVPALENDRQSSIDSSDSAAGDTLEELKKHTKKRGRKKKSTESDFENLTPIKIVKTNSLDEKKEPWRFSPDITAQNVSDDSLESSQSLKPLNAWGTSNEFENFIAKKIQGTNLKIKKVNSTRASPSVIAPLEIPVLDNVKKSVHGEAQTNIIHTASTSSQTSGPGSLSMKINKPLSSSQSEKACEFLKSIVKTTSELGQLMTQKSDDFIEKKINKGIVVDTFKMDYCVKKSFLLLKLAKHNLMQMEEDLGSQYEKFLQDNDLLQFREQEKKIEPKPKEADSDSDCEIIENTTSTQLTPAKRNESKSKFNPKTVFLNKELSIKIAKKPSEEAKPSNKNLNIKGRHTVWINDSVMVKKVKCQQSFLAQDSRNKKPPDNKVTSKMVSDFFEDYYRKKAVQICAPFVSTEWSCVQKKFVCGYFSIEPDEFTSGNISRTDEIFTNTESNATVSDSGNELSEKTICEVSNVRNPTTLFSICLKNLQDHLVLEHTNAISLCELPDTGFKVENRYQPLTLFSLCLEHLTKKESPSRAKDGMTFNHKENSILLEESLFPDQMEDLLCLQDSKFLSHNQMPKFQEDILLLSPKQMSLTFPSLKTLCCYRVSELYCANDTSVNNTKPQVTSLTGEQNNPEGFVNRDALVPFMQTPSKYSQSKIKSLFTLCVELIQCCQDFFLSCEASDVYTAIKCIPCLPMSLKQIAFEYVKCLLNNNSYSFPQTNVDFIRKVDDTSCRKVRKLAELSFDIVSTFYENAECINADNRDTVPEVELTINAVNTLSEEAFLNIEESNAPNSDYYEDDDNMYEDELLQPDTNTVEELDNNFYQDEVLQFDTDNVEQLDNNLYEDEVLPSDTNNVEELDNILYEDEVLPSDTNNVQKIGNNVKNENWVSQVQVKELVSCVIPNKCKEKFRPVIDNDKRNMTTEPYPVIALVKTEPGLEELPASCDNFISVIKTEPSQDLDQMTIIPESVITKRECLENIDPLPAGREPIQRHNSTSYDEDSFEAFVSTNKMIRSIDKFETNNRETFSQSALRVRRQHEPDSDDENDTSMSLLVPQTFEPLTIESAKGSLLEDSSSNEENCTKKNLKRKPKPMTKRKPKKNEPVKPNTKEVPPKDKHNPILAMLTRRMRDKIRQEEKKVESSDSESESISQNSKETNNSPSKNSIRTPVKKNKSVNNEIQCNNVDSTEKVDVPVNASNSELLSDTKEGNKFTGFSAVDQNEISTYHKYVKYVYDQIIPKVNEEGRTNNTKETSDEKVTSDKHEILNKQQTLGVISDKKEISDKEELSGRQVMSNKAEKSDEKEIFNKEKICNGKEAVDEKKKTDKKEILDKKKKTDKGYLDSKEISKNIEDETIENNEEIGHLIRPDEPIELLECTPTMPMFDDIIKSKKKTLKFDTKSLTKKVSDVSQPDTKESINQIQDNPDKEEKRSENFIERHGWKCYPIDSSDTKIYEQVIVPLEKLPESFVETYFQYQGISKISKDDAEIDRLTNLQSLNRLSSVKKYKSQTKSVADDPTKSIQRNTDKPMSPVATAEYNELTPSEDEGADYDDDLPTATTAGCSENNFAKNCLMNDDDDSDPAQSEQKTPTKQEPGADKYTSNKKLKTGPKSKMVEVKHEHPDSLMLTADKMMNKELNLLHLPVVLDGKNAITPVKGPVTRNKQKNAMKYYNKLDRSKSDDSSSEEEKQWVTTKEKLLKRLGRKQESALEDDAKRAKLVSEFIEKRNDKPEVRKTRGPSKRSRRKLLERQKQMRVLSHELLGDASTHIGKGNSQAYFKGRRNIRKVIDKKSLARSTVIANMEEFERKRRLSLKQIKLQELMGCDEGVNVLVINDEVCLEYDFEGMRPAVTVHPFFTKVMKAHQYEGVKFMWDACFESLQMVQTGHPGGGCILAHCMGLGKTLQVLALLHTVLTHPRVGMHRVLVCCPLSTVLNWVDEIHKWIGPVTDEIKVFELSKLKKTYERAYQLEDWYSGGGIFIIGYELFRSLTTLDAELDDIRQTIIDKIRTALLDPGPDIIICDEGHLLKNDSSVLAVAMSRVVTRRRIVLTGTPMQNNLREYYCMVNFVKPNLLGTYSEYSNRFENPIMNGQHRDSQVEDIKLMKARTHILHKVLEGCLQRQEVSVLYPYLPKKHEYTVFITLTKCQCDLYKHYLNYHANKQKQSILKDFHTLQKIWSHPQVLHNFQMKSRDEKAKVKAEKLEDDLACEDLTATEDMKPLTEDVKPSDKEVWWLQYLDGGKMLDCLESSNKFVAVFRILQEAVSLDDKVLIFSTSLITMDSLEFFLKKINKWSLGQEYYRLDGSVPPEVRQKWCREFNAENNYKTKVFLISTRAGSLGLNMTAANRVIILDTSWNPAHDIQSIFRVYRFGQKKDCYIYRLVALGTMEQKIYERAVTKQAVSCRVVDEQQIDRHYNMAELTELYRFDETGVGVAGGVAVGVQDVVLLRVARDAALHAVHEHDSLLRGSEPALPEHERAAAWHQFQQETQRDQMKNESAVKKEKKVAKRSLSIDKSSTVTEIKDEPTDDAKPTPPTEPRPKRGKKIINCCIPIQPTAQLEPQPSTSKQSDEFLIDKDQENDMVSKITQILLSHDFNSKKGARDISKLIGTVRQIVANGDLSKLPPGDELAASIAQVLLRKSSPPMPALTDVRSLQVQEDSHTVPPQDKLQIEDDTSSDFNTETITGDLNSSVKTKKNRRKAAVSAEKKLDSIAPDDLIDLNDNDWLDEQPSQYRTQDTEKRYIPGPKSKKKIKESKPKEKPIEPVVGDESILLLSDDDDPVVQPTVTVKEELPETSKRLESADADEENYPLHPSLLSNQNFVKIVAHTYLAGNPMLDEDAATLAARYSTSKALRELEATGKPIDSGPIYDIAIKVLGKDILKKLHTSGSSSMNTASKSSEQNVLKQNLIKDTEKMLNDATGSEDRPKLKVKVTSDLMPKEKPKPKIPNLGFVKLTPVTPQPPVVPVGLIKRAVPVDSNEPQSGDECILPDDDDVRIVSPPAAPEPAPPAQDHRLLCNISGPVANPALENRPIITICGNKIISVSSGAPPPPPASEPAASAPADATTICLDSDDEDAPLAPPPVPVALTAASAEPPALRLYGDKHHTQKPNILKHQKGVPGKSDLPAKARPGPSKADPVPETPVTKNVHKETKKLCKPGDIIRISKTGQVEVLNQVNPGSEMHAQIIQGRVGSITKISSPGEPPPRSGAATPEKAPPRSVLKAKRVRASSSESSGSSRATSPARADEDPLAILRDVVHIPAALYQQTTSPYKTTSPSKAPPPKKTSEAPAQPSKKPASAQQPSILGKEIKKTQPLSSNAAPAKEIKENPKNLPMHSSKNPKNVPMQSSSLLSKLSKSLTVGKSSRLVMESVDLTDAPEPSAPVRSFPSTSKAKPSPPIKPKPTPPIKPKETPKTTIPKNIVVTGSSKSIFLTPSNTLKGGVVRVSNPEPRTDSKKRPAVKVEPEAPKRKKTDRPMTLKDFDIDDIDDIIELE